MRAAKSTQSIIFDVKASDEARLRQQPIYVESITIIGRPEAKPQKSVEARFADALNGPATLGIMQFKSLDTTPCMSLASTWNNIGASFVPMSGCPK
jgi:hypothetical protein